MKRKRFIELQNELFRLFEKREFEAIYRCIDKAKREFPERIEKTSFWEVCALSAEGKYEEAIVSLNEALEKGIWWNPPTLMGDEDLKGLFVNTKDPKRILEQLTFATGKTIKPQKTLIIFDEIQECPDALNSLKYFNEEANEYHIACAGSLLGIKLSHTSFPVGKVEYMQMHPMTFTEFLLADNQENLVQYMESITKIEKIPELIFNQLSEKIKSYFIIGGMPEVVKTWVTTKDIEAVNRIQKQILQGYEDDFGKHTNISNMHSKISIIWESIISQLSRENKKFLYQTFLLRDRFQSYFLF